MFVAILYIVFVVLLFLLFEKQANEKENFRMVAITQLTICYFLTCGVGVKKECILENLLMGSEKFVQN